MRVSRLPLGAVVGLLLAFSLGCAQEDDGSADFAEYGEYKDPGVGAWEMATPEYCKMDPSLFVDSAIDNYAVFRYGKLCHMKGTDTVGDMYSATKTLGGIMAGRAAYLAREIERTGPGTGPIRHTDLGTDWIASPTYPNTDATINHIMAMVAAASPSLEDSALTFRYDGLGTEAINGMIEATENCIRQVPGLPADAVAFVQQEIFDKMGMTSSAWDPWFGLSSLPPEMLDPALALRGYGISIGWTSVLSDIGKLGTLLLHDGWYGGERLLSQEWVYRMSHPAFESASTSYGQLTWLNHRGNAVSPSSGALVAPELRESFLQYAGFEEGDPCAPAAFWPKYPHPPSEATDCMATVADTSCTQEFDVGVYNAWGMNGQLIVMHPGLDMVIASQNFFRQTGEEGEAIDLWDAIRPGVVAMDPKYQGDEEAFCRDYGAGNYAPDLVAPRWKP